MPNDIPPFTRRDVLVSAAGGAVAACTPDSPAPSARNKTTLSPELASRLEARHGAGLVVMVPLGPIQANCYLVVDTTSSSAVVIDPGGEPEALAAYVRQAGWTVTTILATHGHIDHVAAVEPLRRLLAVPFAMHSGDRAGLARIPAAGRMYGYPGVEVPTCDRDLRDVSELQLGAATLRVLHTPGHSPGCCCFLVPEWRIVFTGDTLFHRSVGRTDLPGGSPSTLVESIRRQLYTLGDDIVAYCGHEEPTTIGEEKRANPFVQG